MKFEVVCSLIATHITRHVEADNEKQARQKVWNSLSDNQKDNCSEIEVFELDVP
jgi:hypothetical protein